jgi:hypothetical protein
MLAAGSMWQFGWHPGNSGRKLHGDDHREFQRDSAHDFGFTDGAISAVVILGE